jgi:hypothetical protein
VASSRVGTALVSKRVEGSGGDERLSPAATGRLLRTSARQGGNLAAVGGHQGRVSERTPPGCRPFTSKPVLASKLRTVPSPRKSTNVDMDERSV